jgi:hypothetical protein
MAPRFYGGHFHEFADAKRFRWRRWGWRLLSIASNPDAHNRSACPKFNLDRNARGDHNLGLDFPVYAGPIGRADVAKTIGITAASQLGMT